MTSRLTFGLYFFATFLQAAAYGLVFLLPPLFADFGADEKDVGTVLLFTTISTLLSVLYLSHITAKLGRMNTLVIASAFIAISLYLLGQAEAYGVVLFVAASLLGLGWGLFYVLTPIVLAEITAKDDRVRVFTLLSVFIMAGFGLSPVLGAELVKASFGINVTFLLTSGCCLFSGLVFFLLRMPIAKLSGGLKASDHSELSWDIIYKIVRSKAIRPIIMVGIGASVFAAVTNFQTVYAETLGLDYTVYFLAYTVAVIVCRVAFAAFTGGRAPYGVITLLLGIMALSIIIFAFFTTHTIVYIFASILFGIGYGVAYPIVKAMAANDADPRYLGQTLQIFGLSYFVGVFGFPFLAGWIITESGIILLLVVAIVLAIIECLFAFQRYLSDIRSRA